MKLARLGPIWTVLGIALLGAAPATSETVIINQFSGLNTDYSPATLTDGQTPDAENVVTDEGPGLSPRYGFTLCNASSATAAWVFPHSNGTRYQIIQSGGVLKADTGSCSFGITVSTVAANINVTAAVLGDKFFFASTTDGLKYWDTSSVVVASASLKITQLVAHKNRLWAAGHSSFPRTVFASKFGDGTSWDLVVDPAVTDPAQFVIGGAVDEPLTALYSSHRDAIVWMKSMSFGVIDGNSRADFTVRTYSDNVGTAYPDSIRDCDGLLRWLGPARTIYEWNGSHLENIGKNIKGYLSQIGQGDANSRSFTLTTQSDYNNGTLYQKSSAIVSGDIMLTTWTRTDTATADFNAFTSSSNVTVVDNRVYLSTSNTAVDNGSFESAVGSEWTLTSLSRVASLTGTACGTISPQSGSFFVGATGLAPIGSDSILVEIQDAAGNILATPYNFTSLTTCAWNPITVDLSAYVGRYIKINSYRQNGSGVKTATFLCSGGTMTFYAYSQGSNAIVAYDNFGGGRSSIYSGTLSSQAFDTSLTSAAWLSSGASWTTNGHSITMQTQSSSNGSTWQTAVAWSTGSAPASDFRRYIRWVVTISTGNSTNGTALPFLDDVTLAARANYGAFISSSIATGSPTSWGTFGADTTADGGTVAYAVYTDTDTVMTITNGVPTAQFVSSQTITSGSFITLSTSAYVRVGETETIAVSTQNPTNHSLTLSWSEGNTTKTPSTWFRQRYWLGVSQNSTSNNRVIVFDRNRQWQRYSGISAASLVLYNGNLFFGNSSGVFQYETAYADAGSAISAYFRTATYSPSGPNLSNAYDDLEVTTELSAQTLASTFQLNGDTSTDYSLASQVMNEDAGIQNFRLSFPFSQAQSGRNISVKFAVSGTTFWRILGATLDFTPDVVPE
jgi:hypothetical protein